MAITLDQAVKLSTFHVVDEIDKTRCYVWRRNGQTQTWVTRPDQYRVPVKYGWHHYGSICAPTVPVKPGQVGIGTNVFAREDCPACKGAKS